jgi:hypothetical protein
VLNTSRIALISNSAEDLSLIDWVQSVCTEEWWAYGDAFAMAGWASPPENWKLIVPDDNGRSPATVDDAHVNRLNRARHDLVTVIRTRLAKGIDRAELKALGRLGSPQAQEEIITAGSVRAGVFSVSRDAIVLRLAEDVAGANARARRTVREVFDFRIQVLDIAKWRAELSVDKASSSPSAGRIGRCLSKWLKHEPPPAFKMALDERVASSSDPITNSEAYEIAERECGPSSAGGPGQHVVRSWLKAAVPQNRRAKSGTSVRNLKRHKQ